MKSRKVKSVIRLAAILVLVATGAVIGEEPAAETNAMCPVMTDQSVVDDYNIVHKGKVVRFCCDECRKQFLSTPTAYEDKLPQLAQLGVVAEIKQWYQDYQNEVSILAIALLLVGLRVYRFFRTVTPADLASPLGRLWMAPCSGTIPFMLATGFLGWALVGVLNARGDDMLEDYMHYATFYDFGCPPQPEHPGAAPRLSGTYYRGNDERNPRLFNEGNYRTASFHIALCDKDGRELAHGDHVRGRQLFVRFEIERAPFTPDFLYSDELMSKMFLTRQCEVFLGREEPVADRVDLSTVEPLQRWQSIVPITASDGACCGQLSGVVYVCEEYYAKPWYRLEKEERGGSRYHYGLKYRLHIEDGRLAGESDLWMNALYRTRKFEKTTIPMSEWFSHKPIPALPGANVLDPDLLGISDYVD